MSKKLLYFNLALDENDTSLGFAIDWIETIAKNYDHVDVITLKKVSNLSFQKNIRVYGAKPNKYKIYKYIYLFKKVKELSKENTYNRCFSHMSPISILVSSYYLKKNKINSTLWFTHPGPKFGIKKLILFLSFIISEHIVTASMTSFPIKSKKVHVIGHAVDLVNFSNKKEEYKLQNFLILSRISPSKNIEIAIDGFLNSKFKDCNLDIIGGPLNKNDEVYFAKLKEKYSINNVNFLGKINHTNLPEVLKNYDVHFNCSKNGFFDKSVLETLSCEIINFYVNKDFNILFENNLYQFDDSSELSRKLDNLTKLSSEEIKDTLHKSKKELQNNSLNSLNSRLEPYL
tara:strand:+ start:850 stop:1881 length:1032 start_codon:yes stop_codon:yes gene_type:complete